MQEDTGKATVMSIENQVNQILFTAIEEINEQLPPHQKIKADRSTQLFGKQGVLDSLTLVQLIVAAEQEVQDTLNIAITLADERALSQKNSPFKSVESLANYIVLLVKEKSN
jgi:D-alanine--poly(phosphoribitol) ligase subunit 2